MKNSATRPLLAIPTSFVIILISLISCDQKEDKLKTTRNNWSTFIYASSTQYQYSKLGGIDEFDIPIRNNTDYLIEEMKIKVRYIKEAGGVFKTEFVTLNNILPHSIKNVRAPKSNRGTSVDFEIVEVYSREMKFCYPQGGGDVLDPYYCR